jgi:hypothetical protein
MPENPYLQGLIAAALEEDIQPQRFTAFVKESLWAIYNNSRRQDTAAAELHNNPTQLRAMQAAYERIATENDSRSQA